MPSQSSSTGNVRLTAGLRRYHLLTRGLAAPVEHLPDCDLCRAGVAHQHGGGPDARGDFVPCGDCPTPTDCGEIGCILDFEDAFDDDEDYLLL